MADWIQYRQNFRAPVARRTISGGRNGEEIELAFDLRRANEETIDGQIERTQSDPEATKLYVEEWVPISKSCVWQFNVLYWTELGMWEEVSGKGYAQALPGGESQATNVDQARGVIFELFRIWDGLVERRALPDQLTVLELGVGNGDQAKVWLDEFVRLDREHGRDYYRRLHYLMGDYSTLVLDLARANTVEHRARVSTLQLDAARPRETLRFLEGKIFFVYVSNVYDNLPTDELTRIDDVLYQIEVRLSARRRRRQDRRHPRRPPCADGRARPASLAARPTSARGVFAIDLCRLDCGNPFLAGRVGGAPPRGALRPTRTVRPL